MATDCFVQEQWHVLHCRHKVSQFLRTGQCGTCVFSLLLRSLLARCLFACLHAFASIEPGANEATRHGARGSRAGLECRRAVARFRRTRCFRLERRKALKSESEFPRCETIFAGAAYIPISSSSLHTIARHSALSGWLAGWLAAHTDPYVMQLTALLQIPYLHVFAESTFR